MIRRLADITGLVAWLGLLIVAPLSAQTGDVLVTLERVPAVFAVRLTNPRDTKADARLATTGAQTWQWRCQRGDVLMFDAPGFEPLDVDDRSCSNGSVRLAPRAARIVTLMGDARPATLEWRQEAPGGSVLLASREYPGLERATVPVASENRILRIRPALSAPVSIFVSASELLQPMRLNSAQGGGELYAVHSDAVLQPESFVLDGPATHIATLKPDRHRRLAVSGLLPGGYSLTPRYRGGISGRPVLAKVVERQTTELIPLGLTRVGGVALEVDSALVTPDDAAGRVHLRHLSVVGGTTRMDEVFAAEVIAAAPRDWSLEGLTPGRYDATLERDGRLQSSAAFDVFPDAIATVRLGRPKAIASGRVFFGKRPAPGIILSFFDESHREWRAKTDASGDYEVAVADPGQYNVHIKVRPYLTATSQTTTLKEGVNRTDFHFGAGTVHLTIRRDDNAPITEPVQLQIRGRTNQDGVITAIESQRVDLVGLLPGSYRVSAITTSGLASTSSPAFSIEEDPGEVNITLVLSDVSGRLAVVDERGDAVSNAQISGPIVKLTETSAGSFNLTRVSPGTTLIVMAPGYAPTCHVFAAEELPVLTVRMVRAAAVPGLIRLSPATTTPIGIVSGLPTSNCALAMFYFRPEFQTEQGGTLIRLFGLPEGSFMYRPTPTVPFRRLQVPGPPATFVLTDPK